MAKAKAVAVLANSAGCRLTGPNTSHECEPLISGATKTVTVNVSGGGSDYPYSKTMTCTSKNYSGGTWVYTLRYSVNNSNLWNVDQSYTFHHNSGYT